MFNSGYQNSWKFIKNDNFEKNKILQQINYLICNLHYNRLFDYNVDYISNNIWLGNKYIANDFNFLIRNGIKHIINVTTEIPNYFDFIKYYNIPIQDKTLNKNIAINALEYGSKIIHQCVSLQLPILIHCKRGHHRSATVLIYYFIKYRSFKLIDAMKFIKEKRPLCFRRMTNFLYFLLDQKSLYDP
jgi:protein-tyrosine phosphatase